MSAPPSQSRVAFLSFSLSLLAGSVAAWTIALVVGHPVSRDPWPTWLILAIAVVGMFLRTDIVAAGKHMVSFVMTDAVLVFALLVGRPESVPIFITLTMTITALRRRPPVSKVIFNLSQELLGGAVAALLFEVISDHHVVSLRTGAAAVVAGISAGVVSAGAIGFGSRLAGNAATRATRSALFGIIGGSFGNAAIALEVVYLGSISPFLALVPALPLMLVVLAFRGIRDQQHTTDRADLLYRATSALHEFANLDDGLIEALEQVRRAIRAHTARVVLFAPHGSVTCLTGNSVATSQSMNAASPAIDQAAREIATSLPGALLVRASSHGASALPFSDFATADAIFAVIRLGDAPAGLVAFAADPTGVAELYQSDVDLAEVLAKQAGLAIERGDLERSLSQLLELEKQLTQQAHFDTVTGLANRNFLNAELARHFSSAPESSAALLLVDLDDFKTVNDSLGHVAGDRLLAAVADRLVQAISDNGLVARLGGDEFALFLTHDVDVAAASTVAARVISSMSELFVIDGREIGIGASVGIRLTDGFPDSAQDLLRDADLALYNAKHLGKGRAAIYAPEMHIEVQERLSLTAALSNAVDRNEFSLAYQPIFELSTGRLAAVEALVRWRHPDRGELLPGSFLSLTEESGLIVGLGEQVLKQALTTLATWDSLLEHESFYIAVNVSGRQLVEPDFTEMVLDNISSSQLRPDRLLLEITESVFIAEDESINASLTALSRRGVRLGLDDFGTGYSSLSQLHRFPMSQLKIDRSFVSRIMDGTDHQALVSAIVAIAQAMKLDIVAEGIETDSQLDFLTRLGCARGQGWLLGRPKPASEITDLLIQGVHKTRLLAS